MAEAVSFAASIIALIQLTGKLTTVGYGYISGVKRAPKDVAELVLELESLGKELIALKDYSDKHPNSPMVRRLNSKHGPLQTCLEELNQMQSKLDIGGGLKGLLSSMKWPIKEKDTLHHIARIERQKSFIVFALATDNLSVSKGVEGYVKNTDIAVRGLQAVAVAQTALQASEKRTKVLNWLYPSDPSTKHLEITSRRQPNTGDWLIKSPEFREHLEEYRTPHLLWGYGIPGAGKTFLSSVVIDHLEELAITENYGVAYIYFDYQERDHQKTHQVLGSLVKQLAGQIEDLPIEVESLHDRLGARGKRAKLEELYDAFLETLKAFSRVFLVFDALDECDPGTQLTDILTLLHRIGSSGATMFVTSRLYPEIIQQSLQNWAKIELSAHNEDITTYIQQRIDDSPRASRLILQARCQDRIISELVDCAQGMFLVVRFHIEYLCQQATAKQLLTALSKLRSTSTKNGPLDSAYERCFETVRKQPENCAKLGLLVLSWLVKAQRTLTVDELRVAVSVECNRYELDEMDLPEVVTILDICAGLVTVDGDNIRLAHYTAQEYLLRKSVVSEEADLTVALTCITYLSFKVFAQGACTSYDSYRARLKVQPFLDYAARYVSHHMRCSGEELLTTAVLKFLESRGNMASAVQVFRNYDENSKLWYPPESYEDACVPIYIASYLGHVGIVRKLLQEGATLSVRDDDGQTNLHTAAYEGHTAVVQALLDNGADFEERDNHGSTTLLRAAQGGHTAVVQLLLDKGADINAQNMTGKTALHLAAISGHEMVVQLLLNNGADVLTRDLEHNTGLLCAAFGGNEAIIHLILARGADISDCNILGQTSLHVAAQKGQGTVVQLLLHKDLNISVLDKAGSTALHHAAQGGDETVVQLLLDNGADISARDEQGSTAFLIAASQGHINVMQLLISHSADISDHNSQGNTVLHLAANGGHEDVVQMLLHKGADASALDTNGNLAIHYAIIGGHETTTQLLLNLGVDITVQDKNGFSALHLSANAGHERITQLLLDNGADISGIDNSGATALHYAASGGHAAVVKLLLGRGANPSTQNSDGNTALFLGASSGHETVTQLLIGDGTLIQLPNKSGNTALHAAALGGNELVAHLLLQNGAELSVANELGNTALHRAAYGGNLSIVQLLLEKGADSTVANERGLTALHYAAEKGHKIVAELLLINGSDLSAKNVNGDSPLNAAAMARQKEVVQFLLARGSNLKAINNAGNTVLHSAAYGGSESLVQLLLDQGADSSIRNHDGETALQLARRTGRDNIVNLLSVRDGKVGWWPTVNLRDYSFK